jgi:3-methylcrotonyl-CoA carboxylase beta subunit
MLDIEILIEGLKRTMATAAAESNRLHWEDQEKQLDALVRRALMPGGDAAVARLAKQNKRPVRELISRLIDPGET